MLTRSLEKTHCVTLSSEMSITSKLAALAADDADDVADEVVADASLAPARSKGLAEVAGEVHAEEEGEGDESPARERGLRDIAAAEHSRGSPSRGLADIAAEEHAYGSDDDDADEVLARATEVLRSSRRGRSPSPEHHSFGGNMSSAWSSLLQPTSTSRSDKPRRRRGRSGKSRAWDPKRMHELAKAKPPERKKGKDRFLLDDDRENCTFKPHRFNKGHGGESKRGDTGGEAKEGDNLSAFLGRMEASEYAVRERERERGGKERGKD